MNISEPITREEIYLAKLTGEYNQEVPEPITRREQYLYVLCKNGVGDGENLSPEEIQQAVDNYLEKNPPTVTLEKTGRIEMTSDDAEVELQSNVLYVFPEMSELSVTLAQPMDATIANEYHVIFYSGETPTMLMLPDAINVGDLTIEANKIYELSIMENLLLWQSWEVQNA